MFFANPPPPYSTCMDCWPNGWNGLWRGHSVYRNRPLSSPTCMVHPPPPGERGCREIDDGCTCPSPGLRFRERNAKE